MNRRRLFPNSAEATADSSLAFFGNESIAAPDTAKRTRRCLLAPYGDWPNTRGLQVFRKEDADNVVNEFQSIISKVLNPSSWQGLPWYEGHPDHPDFKGKPGHTRSTAVGRIKSLEAGSDGLYANVLFNKDGEGLIEGEAYHGHSVNWYLKQGKQGETGYRPYKLRSVGFTNEPNIPVPAVTTANAGMSEGAKKAWETRKQHTVHLPVKVTAYRRNEKSNYKVWTSEHGNVPVDREELTVHAVPHEAESAEYTPGKRSVGSMNHPHLDSILPHAQEQHGKDIVGIGSAGWASMSEADDALGFTSKKPAKMGGNSSDSRFALMAAMRSVPNAWSDAAREAAIKARQSHSDSAEKLSKEAIKFSEESSGSDDFSLHREATDKHREAADQHNSAAQHHTGVAKAHHSAMEKYHESMADHHSDLAEKYDK